MHEERTYTRQEFFDLVWSKPMQQLAKEFGLSDVGLAKTCKRWLIPRPPRGYWQQLAVNKAPKRPKLPTPSAAATDVIRFFITNAETTEPVTSPEVASCIKREKDPANRISVPAVVHKYHALVRATKEHFMAGGPAQNALAIRVSDESLPRALRLWHALIGALEGRGFSVGKQDSWHRSLVTLLGESVGLVMDELTRKVERRNPTPQHRWHHVPTGKVRFVVEHRGTKTIIAEKADRPLEDQLNDVVIALVRMAIDVARPQRLADEEDARRRADYERQQRVVEQRRDRFEAAFRAWKEFEERRYFVELLEAKLAAREDVTDAARDFVAWTRRYLNASDPLPKLFDSLMKNEAAQYRQFTTESPRRWW